MNKPATDNEVVRMFQHYLASNDSSEIDKLSARDLIAAEARLTLKGFNPSFTAAINAQVRRLEQKERRKHESNIRAWTLVTGLLLSLVVAGVSALIFGR